MSCGIKHIIVPVDGSEAASRAAQFAAQLAHDEAEVTLVYVYDAPAASMLGLAALSEEKITLLKENVAKQSFESAKAAMTHQPHTVNSQVGLGHPGKEIVSIAKSKHADMIVMGTRGLSTVQEIMMGSVSDYVLHHAHCPVTVVR